MYKHVPIYELYILKVTLIEPRNEILSIQLQRTGIYHSKYQIPKFMINQNYT